MSRRQTRKTLSLSGSVYNALAWAAAQANKTTSQFVTDLIRQHVPDVPQTRHVERHEAARARVARERALNPPSKVEKLANEVSRIRGVLARIEAVIERQGGS